MEIRENRYFRCDVENLLPDRVTHILACRHKFVSMGRAIICKEVNREKSLL